MAKADIQRALSVAVELTGAEFSDAAMRAMVFELARYPEAQVLAGIQRAQRECRGRLTLADIIGRLDDGRPGPEEAWALVPKSEDDTVVWTEEMQRAYFEAAAPLLNEGDAIAARKAFLERYAKELTRARDERRLVLWRVSLGHDKQGREFALRRAAEQGRLPQSYMRRLLGVQSESKALTNDAANR